MIDKNGGFAKLFFMIRNDLFYMFGVLLPAALLLPLLLLALVGGCQESASGQAEARYVVLSPELAEIIAVIEGTNNIVGVTEECAWPAELQAKARVGKFGALDREKIIALQPTLVFASSLEQQAAATELAKLGIPVHTVYPRSIEELLEAVKTVGAALKMPDRAAFVADSLRAELDRIKATPPPGGSPRPKVYLEIYREPLMSVADSSFVGQLIELAGGDNIFSHLERDYSRIRAEDVIRAKPDIMICYSRDSLANIQKRLGWQDIPAVKNNRICFENDLNPDWILRAGPRCVQGAKRLREILYENK